MKNIIIFLFPRFKLASEKFRDDHYTEVQGLERALAQERSRLELQETTAAQTITQLKTDLEKVIIVQIIIGTMEGVV